jgi:hypothetical protein
MKSLSGKLGIIIMVFIFAGCATTQTSAPPMPKYTTDAEKACARTCQSTYAQCNIGCGGMIGGMTTALQRKQCLDNCNQTLRDCYSSCEQTPRQLEQKGM